MVFSLWSALRFKMMRTGALALAIVLGTSPAAMGKELAMQSTTADQDKAPLLELKEAIPGRAPTMLYALYPSRRMMYLNPAGQLVGAEMDWLWGPWKNLQVRADFYRLRDSYDLSQGDSSSPEYSLTTRTPLGTKSVVVKGRLRERAVQGVPEPFARMFDLALHYNERDNQRVSTAQGGGALLGSLASIIPGVGWLLRLG
jgi:hypothetical protein